MANPENSEGEAGKIAIDLDLFIILRIGHFTVIDGLSEDDGDLVLIQTFVLYYVNQVIFITN